MIVVILQIMSIVIGGASLLLIVIQLFQRNKKYISYGIGGIGLAGLLLMSSYLYIFFVLKSEIDKYKDKRSPTERKIDSIEGAKKIERNQKEFDSIQKVLQDLQKK